MNYLVVAFTAVGLLSLVLNIVLGCAVVAQNINLFNTTEKVENTLMAVKDAIEAIAAEVTVLQGAVASSNALLTALAAQIDAAAGDEAAAHALAAAVRSQAQALSDAVAANDGNPDTNPTPTI